MDVGRGKSCLILHGDGGVQFKCFHDECSEVTFGKLLKHCEEVTGRPCPIVFWPKPKLIRMYWRKRFAVGAVRILLSDPPTG